MRTATSELERVAASVPCVAGHGAASSTSWLAKVPRPRESVSPSPIACATRPTRPTVTAPPSRSTWAAGRR